MCEIIVYVGAMIRSMGRSCQLCVKNGLYVLAYMYFASRLALAGLNPS